MTRIARIGIGFGLVVLGLFLLVLPGPGILTIAGGLAVLAPEFNWARRVLEWMKKRFRDYFAGPPPSPDGTSPDAPLGEETPLRD